MTAARNKVSLATAKSVPIFLALIVVYASYVITGPLAVEYLLNPPNGMPIRLTAGLAIPIAYYVLLVPVGATWLRLLVVIWRNPGYVPLGFSREGAELEPAPGLEDFWMRDVFVCDSKGLPIWCFHCNNWKPDRAHHNQDTGRCTMKMDHFCPWVGGVVGERTYKYFVQFLFYSFLLSAFTMSVLAFFVAEGREGGNLEVQWLVTLGLAGFFTLFTMGMVGNTLWMTFRNVTTIENINAGSGTFLLAVLLPPELQGQCLNGSPPPPPPALHAAAGVAYDATNLESMGGAYPPSAAHLKPETSSSRSGDSGRPLASELNDPSHSTYFSNLRAPRNPRRASVLPYQERIWKGTVTYPLHLPSDRPPLPAPQPRTYAILETLPGMNPWDLGTAFLNFQSVFGEQLHDWVLPMKHSPCCDHSSCVSQYALGPDFEELLVEAGMMSRPASLPLQREENLDTSRSTASQKKRRRRRRLEPGWQNGERPDGWMSEKEARRMRNDARRSMQP